MIATLYMQLKILFRSSSFPMQNLASKKIIVFCSRIQYYLSFSIDWIEWIIIWNSINTMNPECNPSFEYFLYFSNESISLLIYLFIWTFSNEKPLCQRKSCTCAHILAYLVASSYTLQRWYSSKLFQGDGHFCRYIIFYSNGQLYENAFFFFFISSPPIKSAIIHTSFVHVTFR